ncbi:MAG: hypothetical protein PHE58_01170 [Candidatus Omnitrophica bacterium]|nr:hypothetical protein [Candidatus Omnitrophota bacterium]
MNIRTLFFLILLLCLMRPVSWAGGEGTLPPETVSVNDKIISSLFKSLVKTYITAIDFNKLKNSQISALKVMEEKKFKKRYGSIFRMIKKYPSIGEKFGLRENMNRQDAIALIKSFDKSKMCALVDSVPDEAIAGKFKSYLSRRPEVEDTEGESLLERVNGFWINVREKTGIH